jgi:hypothetical protein
MGSNAWESFREAGSIRSKIRERSHADDPMRVVAEDVRAIWREVGFLSEHHTQPERRQHTGT